MKNLLRHRFEIGRNSGLEIHMCQNVFLQIDARSYLNQRNLSVDQFEYCPLRNIEDRLVVFCRVFAAECDLFDMIEEFLVIAFLQDLYFSILGSHL